MFVLFSEEPFTGGFKCTIIKWIWRFSIVSFGFTCVHKTVTFDGCGGCKQIIFRLWRNLVEHVRGKSCILQCWLKKWLRTNYVSARCLRKLIPSQVTNCISVGCAYFPHSFTNQSLVRAVSPGHPTNHNYFITRICTPAAWYPSNYKLEDFVSFLSAMTNPLRK